ncbi:MAG TPA: GNAT family protein [Thermoleophilaceae bacterium]
MKGDRVGLTTPTREEFVSRWDLYNDPQLGMLASFQTAGAGSISKPPVTREQREALWTQVAEGPLVSFDIRALEDGRFVGEAGLGRMQWPEGSGDIGMLLFDAEDRGRGYGTEAVMLLTAYGFDALGLHRITIRYIGVNEAVVQAVERSAAAVGARLAGVEREAEWAFGGRRDRLIVETVREDFPPNPATAGLRSGGGR